MGKKNAARKRRADTRRAPRGDRLYEMLRGPATTVRSADEHLIQQRTRLAIVSMLAVNDSLTFTELKQLLETTDGNLSVHARKLEDAGFIDCSKSFDGRVPKTEYRLTPEGRRVLERYLAHMESLIRAVREG